MLFSSMENFIRQPEIRLTMKADKDAVSDNLRLIPTTTYYRKVQHTSILVGINRNWNGL